jgi:hypothetical protein
MPPTCRLTSRMASGGTVRTVKGFTGSPDFSVTAATRSMTLSAFGVSVGSAGNRHRHRGSRRRHGAGSGGSGTTVTTGGARRRGQLRRQRVVLADQGLDVLRLLAHFQFESGW